VKLSTEVSNVYAKYFNVGAGTGEGFEHTSEFKTMKYNKTINGPDGKAWKAEIEKEHHRILKNDVFDIVKKADLKPGTKAINSNWACKKKHNGTL